MNARYARLHPFDAAVAENIRATTDKSRRHRIGFYPLCPSEMIKHAPATQRRETRLGTYWLGVLSGVALVALSVALVALCAG